MLPYPWFANPQKLEGLQGSKAPRRLILRGIYRNTIRYYYTRNTDFLVLTLPSPQIKKQCYNISKESSPPWSPSIDLFGRSGMESLSDEKNSYTLCFVCSLVPVHLSSKFCIGHITEFVHSKSKISILLVVFNNSSEVVFPNRKTDLSNKVGWLFLGSEKYLLGYRVGRQKKSWTVWYLIPKPQNWIFWTNLVEKSHEPVVKPDGKVLTPYMFARPRVPIGHSL